jgi:hypothetical protein
MEAQRISALRSRYGVNWPLREFWVDETKRHMRVVGDTIDPILREAVKKRWRTADGAPSGASIGAGGKVMHREVEDGETLLDHLVNYTDGEAFVSVLATCAHSAYRRKDTERRNPQHPDRRAGHRTFCTHNIFLHAHSETRRPRRRYRS